MLLLLALLAGLALPNLGRFHTGATKATERAYILDQLTGLGHRAMRQRRAYVLQESGRPPPAEPNGPGEAGRRTGGHALAPAARPDHAPHEIDLPEGWEVSFDQPLVVRANGVCLGAELTLHHRGAVDVRVRLEPPFCRVDADA